MEFDLADVASGNPGDRTTVYGRIDMSAYTSVVKKEGLSIKAIYLQVREQNSTALPNTGIWDPVSDVYSNADGHTAALKLYATTRAYENAADVGIASPDVLCVQEYTSTTSPTDGAATPDMGTSYTVTQRWFGPEDLHPSGYTIVSDLLIGVACDNWLRNEGDTLEVDILLVAEPVKVSQERLTEMLSQAQDL